MFQKYFLAPLAACSLLAATPLAAQAQTGGVRIGTAGTPDPSAALDVSSTSKGLLLPRLSQAQRDALGTGTIAAPVAGLVIYQTDNTPGLYAYDGAAWVRLGADNLGNHTATTTLNLQGNALVGTGASIGSAVGVGVRADGGLNIGQNTAGNNIFMGYYSGRLTTSTNNQFIGYAAGQNTTTGGNNHFVGYFAGSRNTSGTENTFNGHQAGSQNATGNYNVYEGFYAGRNGTAGSNNTFVGYQGGSDNQGSNNTALGYNSGPAAANSGITNATALGANVALTTSNTVVLGNGANVGIGTTSPAAPLDVNGSIWSRNTVRVDANDTNNGGLSNNAALYFGLNGTKVGIASKRTSGGNQGGLDFYTNDTNRLSVSNGGNVGIGTNAPSQALDVRGNVRLGNNDGALGTGSAIEFVGPGVNTDVLGLYRANVAFNVSELRLVLGDDAGGANAEKFVLGTTGVYNGPDQLLSGGFTPQFTVVSDGSVGIGNAAASPTAALDVAGSARVRGLTTAGVVTTDASGNLSSNSGSGSFILNQTSAGQAGGFRISGNGYIGGTAGIGTTAPATTLDVRAATAAAITVGLPDNSGGALYFGNPGYGVKRNYSNPNDVGLYTTAANLYLSTSGTSTSQFVLLNDGDVGIGTASPGAKLHVAGNMKIDGTNTLEFGAGVAGKETNAGKIGYGTFSNGSSLDIVGAGTGGNRVVRVYAENGLGVNGAVNAQAFNTNSDQRFKQNVRPIGAALASVLALRGVRYEWNALGVQRGGKAGAGQVGLLAQELEKVYPELVSTDADGYKAVNYAQLTPVLLEALKEQQAQIEALKAEAAAAKAQAAQATATLETFEARLRRLEAAAGPAHASR